MVIKRGGEIIFGGARWFRVLDVVPFNEEDESRLLAMLKVEAT